LLESVKAPALREPLAGLLKFAAAFCKPQRELPPPADDVEAFRAQARPQSLRQLPQDSCPTCPQITGKNGVSACSRRGRTSGGCLVTVEVEPELETPQHLPRNAGDPFPLLKAATNVNRPASRSQSGSRSTDSSQPIVLVTKIASDKNLFDQLRSDNG
jgi:hypothetical protein